MQQLYSCLFSSSSSNDSPSNPPPLNIKWQLFKHARTNLQNGLRLISAGISTVAFKAISHLFHDASYVNLSDYYDFQALCQNDILQDVMAQILFQDRLILSTHNRGKTQPGNREQQLALDIIRHPINASKGLNAHDAYKKTNKGVCAGYCVWLAEQIHRMGCMDKAIEFLKTQNLQKGAPLTAVSYHIALKCDAPAQQRIDLILKLLCKEIKFSQSELNDNPLDYLSERETLLMRYLLVSCTERYAIPYRDTLSLEELSNELLTQADFCTLFMKLFKENNLSQCHFTHENDWQRVLELCALSKTLQFFIALKPPSPGQGNYELYCNLEDLLVQYGTQAKTGFNSIDWYASRGKFIHNILKNNDLNLSERETAAIRYSLITSLNPYKAADPCDLKEFEQELLTIDDYLAKLVKKGQNSIPQMEFSTTEQLRIDELDRLTNTLSNFIEGIDCIESIPKLHQELAQKFLVQFPELEAYIQFRKQNHLYKALNLSENGSVKLSSIDQLEKLPIGIWLINCRSINEGHVMLYVNFRNKPLLIDPNLGFIQLQEDIDDHKNQLNKLLALYVEECNLTNVTLTRLEFAKI